ncbi:hypothetical protein ERO13_A13G069700v2 [Gossypium hirsutum]|uniref:Protein PELPK1 n=2 Tax=Gossypium TaxID=3633 RepID=A0ABM2ZDA5_GOSHI|nr:protein PELPK1-like [Gossypium hirsutum]KAG4165283.1 hypothetical protein ERO13_A13G069700v2 [Gossypium hirsutum]TYH90905.1 hypothetical protein ES332_A13G081100v1 [Gossypium tomentosum]
MASFNCFALAFLMALSFASIHVGVAARHLLQQPQTPSLLKKTFPPLPSFPKPSFPKPSIPSFPRRGVLPPLPSRFPSGPKAILPPLPSIPSLPQIRTTIPSIHFFSPPLSRSTP